MVEDELGENVVEDELVRIWLRMSWVRV